MGLARVGANSNSNVKRVRASGRRKWKNGRTEKRGRPERAAGARRDEMERMTEERNPDDRQGG